jgi:Rod binding domain-containing protein
VTPAVPDIDPLSGRRSELAARTASISTREEAEAVAREFERMFLSEMLRPMFEGIETDGMFGGGAAEEVYRPLLIDRYAEQAAASGGVGIADAVLKEILRMQGLEDR